MEGEDGQLRLKADGMATNELAIVGLSLPMVTGVRDKGWCEWRYEGGQRGGGKKQ